MHELSNSLKLKGELLIIINNVKKNREGLDSFFHKVLNL